MPSFESHFVSIISDGSVLWITPWTSHLLLCPRNSHVVLCPMDFHLVLYIMDAHICVMFHGCGCLFSDDHIYYTL